MELSLQFSTVRMNELEMFLVLGSFHLRKILILRMSIYLTCLGSQDCTSAMGGES